jgi:PAS domain-containing protein
MWCLPEDWLDSHPTANEILDRLRDSGRLPEQRDFPAWKRDHLKTFDDVNGTIDETWYVRGGRSIHVHAHADLDGGVCFFFEDVSEQLALTSRLTLLTEVQRATLDTVEDGIAVFGSDGRLAVNNRQFARMWGLSDAEVLPGPHIAKLATLCQERLGHDAAWDIICGGIADADPERYGDWGRVVRTDGKIISVCFTRLPNGATVVTLKDMTDIERFTEAFSEAAA